jgi:glycosyltransferase involved in cell wall biosynthesis
VKLIIQIPCYNEAESLPATLLALPRQIPGVDAIEFLVIDDGSDDGTSDVARRWGVHHIVRHRTNRGLAAAFQSGIDAALAAGADIIVNTDADNQYDARDIQALVAPILSGTADLVVGDRGVKDNAHFGRGKRMLQSFGSWVVQRFSRTRVPDAVSGFRAISRAAARRIYIVSSFSYTTEMLIQAGRKRMAIATVPVRTNAAMRPSRLFSSIPQFMMNTGVTLARAYAMYNPLRVFVVAGGLAAVAGLLPILRFLYYFMIGQGGGHVQSLVLGGVLITLGVVSTMFGVVADLVGRNRQLLETVLERVRRIEDELPKTNAAPPPTADADTAAAPRAAA